MITNHQTGECDIPDCFCHEAQLLEQAVVNPPDCGCDRNECCAICCRTCRLNLSHDITQITTPTFEQEWRDAPKWATRTTEEDSARYWFIRGQHAREVELLVGRNSDLKEIARVVQERLGR